MIKKTPNPIDQHVGGRVRIRRVLTGMSQEKLGEALGLTFQQVQKYEKGTNRIGASRLQQIASILSVQISFFFEGLAPEISNPGNVGEESDTAHVIEFLSTTEGLQLNKAFARIKDPKVRRRVVDLVSTLSHEDAA
jgi:transcriptional regulator with XRE-family HTH domain